MKFRKKRPHYTAQDYQIPAREIFRYKGQKAFIQRDMFTDYWILNNEQNSSFRISEGITQARATRTYNIIKRQIDRMKLRPGPPDWARCSCYMLFRWTRDSEGKAQPL